MNRNRKWTIFSMLTVLFLLLALPMEVYAHDAPDFSRTGTISVEMKYSGKAVGGGKMTLYRVGDIVDDDGDFGFAWIPALEGAGLEIDQLQSPELASRVAAKVKAVGLTGIEQEIDANGKVRFDRLELGLYLAVQTEAAPGYLETAPFLISTPVWDKEWYEYQVDASPKVELEPKPTQPPSGKPVLPQTGQLSWPTPVLSVTGLLLFAMGWYLRFGKKKS